MFDDPICEDRRVFSQIRRRFDQGRVQGGHLSLNLIKGLDRETEYCGYVRVGGLHKRGGRECGVSLVR